MKRGVVYARYSSDLQNAKSVEDQIALCAGYAARNGIAIVGQYFDRARSGASVLGRDGLLNLIEAAKAGRFDVVVVEALDRLSRDQEDLAGLFKRLKFQGIDIVAVHDGKIDQVQIGVRGLLGSLFLVDLAHKVRRGLQAVIRDGRHAGGRAYGYRPVLGKPGEMEIVEEEAAVIRRIFAEYRAGASPRTIAAGLNRDHLPAPRGTRWNASTLNGSPQRGNGILGNSLYTGQLVWNRVRMVRDPDTGKRVSRPNPQSEWQSVDVPHLRIVAEEDAAHVATRKADNANGPQERRGRPPTKRLLSGLLRCANCGGGMAVSGHDRSGARLMCSGYREGRSCTNGSRYYLHKVEAGVVDHLRTKLHDPDLLAEYMKAYREERRALEATARRDRAKAERGLADAKAGISRVVDLVADGMLSKEEARERLDALRADKARWEAQLAAADETTNVIELHPAAVALFHQNLTELDKILTDGESEVPNELRDLFRVFVASVRVHPRKAREPYLLEITGYLAPLIGEKNSAKLVVAGEGLEPPTRGL